MNEIQIIFVFLCMNINSILLIRVLCVRSRFNQFNLARLKNYLYFVNDKYVFRCFEANACIFSTYWISNTHNEESEKTYFARCLRL